MVLSVARISGDNQDELSLGDQEALYRHWLDQHLGGPYDLTMIAGKGSGECLDRADYLRAWDEVATGRYDLVISEDLARVARRAHAVQFCEHCEDHDTRLVALNDQIDTAQENWRVMAGCASMRHEMYNADTAKRIRQLHRNRFTNGGIVQTVVYGYVKPPGAKTDDELAKDQTAGPAYEEMFRLLEAGASYAEVADRLNEMGVPTGRYCRTKIGTGSIVARLVPNPILKGVRVRNARLTKRVNSTGRRKTIKAPPGERLERHCPHLAFIDPPDTTD